MAARSDLRGGSDLPPASTAHVRAGAPWRGKLSMTRPLLVAAGIACGLLRAPDLVARDLTFQERVNAQAAIERVSYSHQIGATRPFAEAVPRAVLEDKVRTYLEESAALETLWKNPISAAALSRELERMERNTRMP